MPWCDCLANEYCGGRIFSVEIVNQISSWLPAVIAEGRIATIRCPEAEPNDD